MREKFMRAQHRSVQNPRRKFSPNNKTRKQHENARGGTIRHRNLRINRERIRKRRPRVLTLYERIQCRTRPSKKPQSQKIIKRD